MSLGQLFSTDSLTHAVSGSLSSVLALAIVYPLDQVRILKQVEQRQRKPTSSKHRPVSHDNDPGRLEEGRGRGLRAKPNNNNSSDADTSNETEESKSGENNNDSSSSSTSTTTTPPSSDSFALEHKYSFAGPLAPVLALWASRGFSNGIYRGIYMQEVALGVSNFIYFYVKKGATLVAANALGGKSRTLTPTQEFTVTTMAGAANAVAAAPLWNVCDKIKTDNAGRYKGIVDCFRKLVVRTHASAVDKINNYTCICGHVSLC